jgi:hypothetical protein
MMRLKTKEQYQILATLEYLYERGWLVGSLTPAMILENMEVRNVYPTSDAADSQNMGRCPENNDGQLDKRLDND